MTTQSIILCDDTIKIVITPKLEKILGRSDAIALQQLHFCLTSNENNGKLHDNKRWIYNTYDEWHESYIPQYSSGTIQRAFTKLEKLGIVSSCQLEKNYGNRRKSYTINYNVLYTLVEDYDEKNPPQKKSIHISPQKRTLNTIQIQQPQRIVLNSIQTIPSQINEKYINTSSHIQPTSSGNALQMITLWNEVVGKDLNQNITSYPKLLLTLNALFERYFDNDCEKWRNYCLKIASSKFLMGEANGYRIRFSYAISENGLNEILYGDKFTFGDRVATKTEEPQETKPDSSSPFEHYQESEQALKLRKFIKNEITSNAIYESWYKPTYIYYNAETNEYTLFAPTRFMSDRIKTINEKIAEKISEFHFFNGQYPEEYFGTSVSHENASEEITPTTQERLTSPDQSRDITETSDASLTGADIYNDDNNLNIHENTTELSSSNCLHTENYEQDIYAGEGEGASSHFQEAENAQQLRHSLKEKTPSDLYSAYFRETFIFVDDNNKAFLFIKHKSHQEPIVKLLKEMVIIFSEISVPPESCYTYYFSEDTSMEKTSQCVLHTSEQNIKNAYSSSDEIISSLPHKEISEGEGTLSISIALPQKTNHTNDVLDTPHISTCYDDHDKMIRWSQQNDMFLTKTYPKITTNIFSFLELGARLKNLRSENRKKEKINIFKKLKTSCSSHHFNSNCIKFRQNLRFVILNVKKTIGEKNYLPFHNNRSMSFQR